MLSKVGAEALSSQCPETPACPLRVAVWVSIARLPTLTQMLWMCLCT